MSSTLTTSTILGRQKRFFVVKPRCQRGFSLLKGLEIHVDFRRYIAVTLPAKSQVLSIAFCFEGSAIFDNICVYHLASAQEEETPSADRTATQTIPEAIVETKPAVLSDERKENIL